MMKNKRILAVLYLLIGAYCYSLTQEDFENINSLFSNYIYSNQEQIIDSSLQVIDPFLSFGFTDLGNESILSNSKYNISTGFTINANSFFYNMISKNLRDSQRKYSLIQDILFRYNKINGDFFTLLSMVYEDYFFESIHDNSEYQNFIDWENILFSNKLYEDMLKKSIYQYSGVSIDDSILRAYIELLESVDFASFDIDDIYQMGIIKQSELTLDESISVFEKQNTKGYGYFPNISLEISTQNVLESLPKECTISTNINIPNLGLTGRGSLSLKNEKPDFSFSLSISFPIQKQKVYSVSHNEYSFSSELFLINLKTELNQYKLLENNSDIQSRYKRVLLMPLLLRDIKKYMELY